MDLITWHCLEWELAGPRQALRINEDVPQGPQLLACVWPNQSREGRNLVLPSASGEKQRPKSIDMGRRRPVQVLWPRAAAPTGRLHYRPSASHVVGRWKSVPARGSALSTRRLAHLCARERAPPERLARMLLGRTPATIHRKICQFIYLHVARERCPPPPATSATGPKCSPRSNDSQGPNRAHGTEMELVSDRRRCS